LPVYEPKDNGKATSNQSNSESTREIKKQRFDLSFFLTFIVMFVVWILLSGRFDVFHLTLGILSSLGVAFFSCDLLFPSPDLKRLVAVWPRFVMYIPWLLYQIFIANLQVLYLTFHPRMIDLIDPKIIEFRSRLKSDLARVTFANSITLTPGTITVFVSIYGDYQVHVIGQQFAEALPGEMENLVAKTFGE
jgi:multicomponent Na+:H+ antiporter subunit E